MQIVEDRTLARIALDVSGRQGHRVTDEARDIALGQAVVILRVLGIAAGPEIVRTLRADIATIFSDPAELARARAFSARDRNRNPANANRATPSAVAVA